MDRFGRARKSTLKICSEDIGGVGAGVLNLGFSVRHVFIGVSTITQAIGTDQARRDCDQFLSQLFCGELAESKVFPFGSTGKQMVKILRHFLASIL